MLDVQIGYKEKKYDKTTDPNMGGVLHVLMLCNTYF